MEADMIPKILLIMSFMCLSNCSHISKLSTSLIGPTSLSVENLRSPTLSKINTYQTSETMSPIFVQAPPLTVSSSNTDQHFQWWDGSSTPDIVHSGWYGFNRFTPRSARNLDKTSNRKARSSFLLGESSQMQPFTSYKQVSRTPKQYDEDLAIYEVLRELQRNIRPLPQRGNMEPRIIVIEEAAEFPPGLLLPMHPHQHHNNLQRQSSYRRRQKELRQLASAPSPVTIKVVPLKITSMDIANALKQMSFVPLSLDFMKGTERNSGGNDELSFDDKSDDELDLPPPSSHVATPLDKPLGITYAEAQRTERFISKYQPR